ncbi:MAG: sel1 repeat family protein [Treponema sp.]|nr:sel1 repeat family protein [Treponema sp.]
MAKCKVCGSRLKEEVAKCPMCGAEYKKTVQPTQAVQPVQPQVIKTQEQKNYPAPVKQELVAQSYEDEYEDEYEDNYEEESEEITSDDLIKYGESLLKNNPPPSKQREAFNCFTEALNMGNPYAHISLGFCYYDGMGCEQDYASAYNHFTEAHYSDIYDGTAMMGVCIFFGNGTAQNKEKGLHFLCLAKDNGSELGKELLKAINKEEKRNRRDSQRIVNNDDDDVAGGLLLGAAFLGGALLGGLFSDR